MRTRRVIAALLIVLAPGIMLWPVWRLGGLGAGEDDILYYFPSRVFFHETIRAGHAPWLNPWSGLDRPYAADPQSAVGYPLTWLFALLPPAWAYPALLWAHYSLALWGMYRLLRAHRLDRRAALFGGVALAFCGFLLAHRAHFTMQQSAAWTPWVFWRTERFIDGPRSGRTRARRWRGLLAAALCAALQCFAGHVQIAGLTALGTLVYLLARPRRRENSASQPEPPESVSASIAPRPAAPTVPTAAGLRTILTRWVAVWVSAAGLFAVQWLPTAAYVRHCTRIERTYWDFVENSWYPTWLPGWLLPMFFGQRTPNFFSDPYWGPSHQVEQFAYAGLVTLVLALAALRPGWRADPRRRPWIILLGFGLLLALGTFAPLAPLLYLVPGTSLFRVPARALLLCNLALAALAAGTLHELGAALSPQRARLRAALLDWTRRPLVAAAVLVTIPLAATLLALPLLPAESRGAAWHALRPWNPALLVPLALAMLTLAAVHWLVHRWDRPALLNLLFPLFALDLGLIGWTLDVPAGARTAAALTRPPEPAWLAPVRADPHRLWVVTDTNGVYTDPLRKRASNTNVLVHVPALTDYGPLQPLSYNRWFGFKPWGVRDDPGPLLQATGWMRPTNVGWILVCGPQWPAPAGAELVATTPESWGLYRYRAAAGMTFWELPAPATPVRYSEQGPSQFTLELEPGPASGPGASDPPPAARLVVSRLALPGWRAEVNGKPVALETAYDALLALRPPTDQPLRIRVGYFPPGLLAGALISAASAAVLIAAAVQTDRRRA